MRSFPWIIVMMLSVSPASLAAPPVGPKAATGLAAPKPVKTVKPGEELPPLLKSGFDMYAKEGPKAAIESWTRGSAIEGRKETLSQDEVFRKLEEFYGKYVGYEFVRKHRITSSTSTYLINIKYEKGNLYSIFYLYKRPDGNLVVTTFNVHTDPQDFWPASAIFGSY